MKLCSPCDSFQQDFINYERKIFFAKPLGSVKIFICHRLILSSDWKYLDVSQNFNEFLFMHFIDGITLSNPLGKSAGMDESVIGKGEGRGF